MAHNRCKAWSEDQIQLLVLMIKNRTPIDQICKTLGRSVNGIRHAILKVLYQQLLDYEPEEICKYYNFTLKKLQNDIVSKKFFVEIPNTSDDINDTDIYDPIDKIDSEDKKVNELENDIGFYKNILGITLTCLFSLGIYQYINVLNDSMKLL